MSWCCSPLAVEKIVPRALHPLAAPIEHVGVDPYAAKAGELQSQGVEGEAVIIYCEPLATRDREFSGFPERVNNMARSALSLEFT
jgi:hypothetical protein